MADAWRHYLSHDNHGRGVILIGHSQGAYILKELVKREIDPFPSTRRLLVSAILLGGDVVVANGSRTGGSFKHVPACSSPSGTGCVIAYSSYAARPPPNSRFGRVASTSEHVLCVNPATPGGASTAITPLLPAKVAALLPGLVTRKLRTPWLALTGLYRASCTRDATTDWLQVSVDAPPGHSRRLTSEINPRPPNDREEPEVEGVELSRRAQGETPASRRGQVDDRWAGSWDR